MRKLRASRLVIPSTLSVAVVTIAVGAVGCSKETTNPEEEGACIALDQPDGGAAPDCSAQPDGGECPPGCVYV
jgi:hypothetical protein